MSPLHLSHFTAASCLGHGLAATLDALQQGRGGLTPCHFETVTDLGYSTWYLVVTFALYWYCRLVAKRWRRLREAAALVFVSVAASGILINIIKFILGRARPVQLFDHGEFGFFFFETAYARIDTTPEESPRCPESRAPGCGC